MLNPGSTAATLVFNYIVEGGGEKQVIARINPETRATFEALDDIGPGVNASLRIESDQDLAAERTMYFNYQGNAQLNWTGGHCVAGAALPR